MAIRVSAASGALLLAWAMYAMPGVSQVVSRTSGLWSHPDVYVSTRSTPHFLKGKDGRWRIRFPATGELRSLAKAGNGTEPAVRVPCFLRKGRWLAATLDSNGWCDLVLSDEDLAEVDPGFVTVTVQSPGWHEQKIEVSTGSLYASDPDLAALARARFHAVPGPGSAPGSLPAMAPSPKWPGVAFAYFPLPIEARSDSPSLSVEAPINASARKVYVCCQSNSDATLADLSRLTARTTDGRILMPSPVPLGATGSGGVGKTVMVLDLGETESLAAIELERPAHGIIGICGITLVGRPRPGTLAGLSPRAQRMAGRETFTLFAFNEPSLTGWEIRGSGWGITDTAGEPFMRKGTSRYFADSKANGGEPATGTILSPPFAVQGSWLSFLANGHSMKNYYALVDAATGTELRRSPVPEKTGPFEKIRWDIRDLRGRQVRFKAVDEDTRTGYAWLAFDDITLEP